MTHIPVSVPRVIPDDGNPARIFTLERPVESLPFAIFLAHNVDPDGSRGPARAYYGVGMTVDAVASNEARADLDDGESVLIYDSLGPAAKLTLVGDVPNLEDLTSGRA